MFELIEEMMMVETEIRDIIVTTPKSEMETAAQEAEMIKQHGGGRYFRRYPYGRCPKVSPRSKVFFVEDGYVRGFCEVLEVGDLPDGLECEITKDNPGEGTYVVMDATSWCWIKPIPMKGFQNFRYVPEDFEYKVIGDWQDPKPGIKNTNR